ncbi:PEP-CTERM sorting domain-containing protein [Pseudocolwellia sp. HL-MZ7]|uniref:PEP-CTERM sorting domain-containing protein n=1 Tax=Pseudocolwellia sp. HL-MZ7 TaxID=3400627 RepID=UPI003CEBF558
MTKKSIIAASMLAAFTAMPSNAAIIFEFDYSTNDAGVGFLDSTEGDSRKAALDTAGNMFSELFGGYFSNSGTINLEVTSSDDTNGSTLASAGSYVNSECFDTGKCLTNELIKTELQTGVDANGDELDGSVDVNWGWDWELDPDTPADFGASEFDFYATIFHELTHALGFGSGINLDGSGYFNDEWTTFDTFLQDSNGNSILDNAFTLDQAAWDDAKEGGSGDGIFFGGANALAANGGNAVGIYSPTSWEEGSSGSHVDGVPFPTDMMKYDRDFGPETRTYSDIDVAILTDLGYTRVAAASVPEPGTIGLGLIALVSGLIVRRRKA